MTNTPWIEYWTPAPARRVRMFCFHHAGGNAAVFRDWHRLMPASVEICPVQLPGRGRRLHEPPLLDLRALGGRVASAIVDAIDGPFALFGYSMGAYVAFETARRLERIGLTPRMLVIAAAPAPHVRSRRRSGHLQERELMERLEALNVTPREVLEHAELMAVLLPIIRSDFQAIDAYEVEPDALVRCPIAGFAGADDPEASLDAVAAWSAYSAAPCTVERLPGDHGFVLRDAPGLAARVAGALTALDSRTDAAVGGA